MISFTKHERLVLLTLICVIFAGGLLRVALWKFAALRYAVHFLDEVNVNSRIDLNRATVEQLKSIPGIGPVMAQRIIEYRVAHQGFDSLEQLKEIPGIRVKTFQKIVPFLQLKEKR